VVEEREVIAVSTDTQETTRGSLHDATLDAEIQLVGDLVVAATVSDGPLTQAQIDAALGVCEQGTSTAQQ
jgi:hypothetical protein